jgi:hypothetical protein
MNDIKFGSISSEHIHGMFLRRSGLFAALGLPWLPVAVVGAGVPGAAKAQESLTAAIAMPSVNWKTGGVLSMKTR